MTDAAPLSGQTILVTGPTGQVALPLTLALARTNTVIGVARFSDPAARERLEAMLHPLVRARLDSEVARWRGPYGLLVVPLLLERGGARSRVDRVLVVDCPEDEQVRRVASRSGLTEPEVRAIMATQLSRASRLAQADDVIDNGGPREALAPQVARLDALYRDLAARA
jgi:dephospho-CoA kinase